MPTELIPPVKEGEIYEKLEIESICRKDDEIAKINGSVIIIPHTHKDDLVNESIGYKKHLWEIEI